MEGIVSPTFLSHLHEVSSHSSEKVRTASVNPLENPEGQAGDIKVSGVPGRQGC